MKLTLNSFEIILNLDRPDERRGAALGFRRLPALFLVPEGRPYGLLLLLEHLAERRGARQGAVLQPDRLLRVKVGAPHARVVGALSVGRALVGNSIEIFCPEN